MKKQENPVFENSVSSKSRGMDTFRDLREICNRRQVFPDENETRRKIFEKI